MKVRLARDEWYPVYMIFDREKNGYEDAEVPDELRLRYDNWMKEGDEIQALLEKIWKETP